MRVRSPHGWSSECVQWCVLYTVHVVTTVQYRLYCARSLLSCTRVGGAVRHRQHQRQQLTSAPTLVSVSGLSWGQLKLNWRVKFCSPCPDPSPVYEVPPWHHPASGEAGRVGFLCCSRCCCSDGGKRVWWIGNFGIQQRDCESMKQHKCWQACFSTFSPQLQCRERWNSDRKMSDKISFFANKRVLFVLKVWLTVSWQ